MHFVMRYFKFVIQMNIIFKKSLFGDFSKLYFAIILYFERSKGAAVVLTVFLRGLGVHRLMILRLLKSMTGRLKSFLTIIVPQSLPKQSLGQ